MSTKLWAFGLVALSTLFIGIAQVLFKFASQKLSWNVISIILNVFIYSGFIVYGIALLLLLIALKHGEVSVLYPVVGLSYVWVTLLSAFFFGETINAQKWIGVATIVIAIIFLGMGSKK